MNLIIKQIIVVIITFLIILWFQNSDDKKHNRDRKSFYDKYKLPLLVSTIIGLILNLPLLFKINECDIHNTSLEIIRRVYKCYIKTEDRLLMDHSLFKTNYLY
jgi:predicted permease